MDGGAASESPYRSHSWSQGIKGPKCGVGFPGQTRRGWCACSSEEGCYIFMLSYYERKYGQVLPFHKFRLFYCGFSERKELLCCSVQTETWILHFKSLISCSRTSWILDAKQTRRVPLSLQSFAVEVHFDKLILLHLYHWNLCCTHTKHKLWSLGPKSYRPQPLYFRCNKTEVVSAVALKKTTVDNSNSAEESAPPFSLSRCSQSLFLDRLQGKDG